MKEFFQVELFLLAALTRVTLHPKLRDKSEFLENTNSLSDRTAVYEIENLCLWCSFYTAL